MLHIIVGLVVVVAHIAGGIVILSRRIVSAVRLHLLFADTVPGDAGALAAVNIYQLGAAATPIPATHHIQRMEPGEGIAYVSLGAVIIVAKVQAEAVTAAAGACTHACHCGVV